jgi:hypothetical protein
LEQAGTERNIGIGRTGHTQVETASSRKKVPRNGRNRQEQARHKWTGKFRNGQEMGRTERNWVRHARTGRNRKKQAGKGRNRHASGTGRNRHDWVGL